MPLQIRRGTQAERETLVTANTILPPGEPLWTTDTGNLYIGDGETPGGVHVNVLPETNLANYTGTIGGGLTPFIDVGNLNIDLDGNVQTNIVPDNNNLYNIGNSGARFNKIWLSQNGIGIANTQIIATPSLNAVELPVNSTIGGVPISTYSGLPEGESYNINIIAADSSLLVDGNTGTIYLDGTVKGNITPNSDNLYDIGDLSNRFRDIYSSRTVFVGNVPIKSSASKAIRVGDVSTYIQTSFFTDTSLGGVNVNGTTGAVATDYPRITIEGHRDEFIVASAVATTDTLGALRFAGFNGVDYIPSGAVISKVTDSVINTFSTQINSSIYIGNNVEIDNDSGNYLLVESNGFTKAPAFVAGSYASGSEPDAAVAGMIIFDSTNQKFKGYVDDLGLAGGGPSNSTPGWVNLN